MQQNRFVLLAVYVFQNESAFVGLYAEFDSIKVYVFLFLFEILIGHDNLMM